MMPERVQLSRRKGWRMPPNTVKVDRTTKWGNPYRAGVHMNHQHAVDLHRMALKTGKCRAGGGVSEWDVALYAIGVHSEIGGLRGKNLACWCPLDAPCHAEVLIELANAASADTRPKGRDAKQARCASVGSAVAVEDGQTPKDSRP